MNQQIHSRSKSIWENNKKFIPGGIFSLNRYIEPMKVFTKAKGAYIWDADGNQYTDYHGAFSPYFLGHSDPDVNQAVIQSLQNSTSLIGAGTTPWEGELAELLVTCIPTMEQVQVTNTGSEATFYAIRLARAITGRDEIIIMQGGYNGWHDDVAFNLMDPAEKLSPYKEGEELPLNPMSAGIPKSKHNDVHVVQFNDLTAVEHLLEKRPIAAIILEPMLQNIGLVKPEQGYLEGLRHLCDRYGTLLVFDEVKTGFRHALGGYQSLCNVCPDLSTFGKAVANGFPLGVIGGKKEYMQYFNHSDQNLKVLIAGTYNGHPVPVAAAIATLKKLKANEEAIYPYTNKLGQMMEEGLTTLFASTDFPTTVVRETSAFVVYFMDRPPRNWLDIAQDNNMDKDRKYRKLLVEEGIFHFPMPAKQGSISFAHTEEDIERTLDITQQILRGL